MHFTAWWSVHKVVTQEVIPWLKPSADMCHSFEKVKKQSDNCVATQCSVIMLPLGQDFTTGGECMNTLQAETHTMVGPTADMDDDSEQVVGIIHMSAVIGGVAQLQLKGEHHPVHQLAHPASTPKHPSGSANHWKTSHIVSKRQRIGQAFERRHYSSLHTNLAAALLP